MTEKDPFIQELAHFRGISYEAAAQQHREDQLIESTEFAMVIGKQQAELAADAPLFEVEQKPGFAEWLSKLFRPAGKGVVLAEGGRLRAVPRPTTPEEDEQRLIDETELTMIEGPKLVRDLHALKELLDKQPLKSDAPMLMSQDTFDDLVAWSKEDK
jgi:hypothetical protein